MAAFLRGSVILVDAENWMLCSRQTHLFALRSSIRLVRTPLLCENKIMVINSIAENPCGRLMRNYRHYHGVR